MKVMVTGSSGLLGRAVVLQCRSEGWNVVPLAFSRAGEGMVKVDIKNAAEVDAVMSAEKPDFVVHCAAERSPDKVEGDYEATKQLNITASSHLTSIAKKYGGRLLYISTDYVFDGVDPPFSVTDEPKPLNKYGLTKLEGEKSVTAADENSLILRVPVLYGPVDYLGESAVTCLFNVVKDASKQSKVSHYEKRYPEHVSAISTIVCQLLKTAKEDSTIKGIFQWSGTELLTKYDMCLAIASAFGLSHTHLIPDEEPSPGAPRPYDSRMENDRLIQVGIEAHIPFSEGIKDCLKKWL